MYKSVKALIFDMDGVIIDSEPLWRKAMITGFNQAGMEFTDEDCRKTTGMRFKEVVEIWLEHYNNTTSPETLQQNVLDQLVNLVHSEGKMIAGVRGIYNYCRERGLKIGLATSSPEILINAVLQKLELTNAFDAVVSAGNMTYGKPHPEVFLVCAAKLNVHASECLVIEDSLNGMYAAKAAQMRVFAVPDAEHRHLKQYAAADWLCNDMHEVLNHLESLLAHAASIPKKS